MAFQKGVGLTEMFTSENPLYAERGLGCGAFNIKCFGFVSMGILLCAGLPQSRYTMGLSCAFTA